VAERGPRGKIRSKKGRSKEFGCGTECRAIQQKRNLTQRHGGTERGASAARQLKSEELREKSEKRGGKRGKDLTRRCGGAESFGDRIYKIFEEKRPVFHNLALRGCSNGVCVVGIEMFSRGEKETQRI
jgi:hypothetical protein